jgi:predicted ATPase
MSDIRTHLPTIAGNCQHMLDSRATGAKQMLHACEANA